MYGVTVFDYAGWRIAMISAIDAALDTFRRTFPYPPGENRVGGPTGAELLMSTVDASAVPAELVEFYRHVSKVDLPDVHNAFFVHPLSMVVDNEKNGAPVWAPALTDAKIAVFGSDGGGQLFALDSANGSVYLLPAGAVHDGVYESRESPRVIAGSLPDFLEWLLGAVAGFAVGDAEAVRYPS